MLGDCLTNEKLACIRRVLDDALLTNKGFFAATMHIILGSWKLIKERFASYFEALFTTSLVALTPRFSWLAEIILCLAFSTAIANACLDL